MAHYDGFAINLIAGKVKYAVVSDSVSELRPGEATYVATGECLPAGASIVVPIEAERIRAKISLKYLLIHM
ncbi:MAG: hypothetical protein ACP5I7_04760 [Sulfolobales archaeon]